MTRFLSGPESPCLARLVALYDAAQCGITVGEYADDAGVTLATAKTYLCALVRAGLAQTVSRAPTTWVPLYDADGVPLGQATQEPSASASAARHLADAERLIEDALRGAVSGYPLQNRLRTAVLPLLRLAREALQD